VQVDRKKQGIEWPEATRVWGLGVRGGSSKLIERGSYRVKGASGVFRMPEKGARGGAKPR